MNTITVKKSDTADKPGYRFECTCESKGAVRPTKAEAELLGIQHLIRKHGVSFKEFKPAKAAKKSAPAKAAAKSTKAAKKAAPARTTARRPRAETPTEQAPVRMEVAASA